MRYVYDECKQPDAIEREEGRKEGKGAAVTSFERDCVKSPYSSVAIHIQGNNTSSHPDLIPSYLRYLHLASIGRCAVGPISDILYLSSTRLINRQHISCTIDRQTGSTVGQTW